MEREDDSLERHPRPRQEVSEPAPEKRHRSDERIWKWVVVLGIGSIGLLVIVVATIDSPETPVSDCTGLVIGSEFATMNKSEFEQRLRKEGCSEKQIENSLSSFDESKVRGARWVEQWDHWANVDAFVGSMEAISADRVVDKDESTRICFLLPQWESQLTAARDYVENYREVEPDMVKENPGLSNLQTEAERGLALLAEAECE